MPPPRVSVAVPLWRSAPFFECLCRNLDVLAARGDVEVLVSDRHGADDTIDRLEGRYGAHGRFRFFRARDALTWVEHYNLLLAAAGGRYFMWMPHDDEFPADYLPRLESCLDRHADVLLAFGRMEPVDWNGTPVVWRRLPPPPLDRGERWSLLSLARLCAWGLGVPVRGLMRRDTVIDAGLYIRPTLGTVFADMYWVFGIGLRGRLCYVPEASCRKRFYEGSTHAQWRFGWRHARNGERVLRSYLRDHAASRRDEAFGIAVVAGWMLVLLAGAHMPPRTRRHLKRVLLWRASPESAVEAERGRA